MTTVSKTSTAESRRSAQTDAGAGLIAVHGTRVDRLLYADKIGGFVAPSIAVKRADHAYTRFGDVVLVAPLSMVDPAREPVFDADIYSPRYPRVSYGVNAAAVRQIESRLAPFIAKTESYWGDLAGEIERGGIQGVLDSRLMLPALQLAFLTERGANIEPPMRPKPLKFEWIQAPALKTFFETHGYDQSARPGDPYWTALSAAAQQAVREHWNAQPNLDEVDKATLIEYAIEQVFDEDLSLTYSTGDDLNRSHQDIGKTMLDKHELSDLLDAQTKPVQAEFEAWAKELLAPLQGEAFIHTEGGKKLKYTPENVLRVMTKKTRGGESFNYGPASARAMGAKKFRSLSQMEAASDRLVDAEAMAKHKEDLNDQFFRLVSALSPYHPSSRRMGFSDTVLEVVQESYKRGRSVWSELKSSGFEDVPPHVVEQLTEYMQALKTAPTEYFEAKPQRIVPLTDFSAIVVPTDLVGEVQEVADKNGLTVVPYEKGNDASQIAAFQSLVGARTSEPSRLRQAVRVPLYDEETAELRETADGAELVTDTGYAVPVPRESLAHIESDLRRVVPPDMTEGSGNEAVDTVIRGEGELLGKGDDGIVWRVGDQVVKMSTVVPYQPLNRGYRTPEEAEAMLKAQTERAAELADIEGIVVPEFVSWGGKGFQVRPYYELPETWTDEEKRSVQRAVETMWDRGLGLRDEVQVGRGAGGPVLFDIGKAGPIRQSDRFLQDELGPEISALKRWLGGPYKPESRAVLQRQWRDYEKAAEGGIYFEVVEDLLDLAEVERVRSLLGEDEGVVERLRSLKGERTAAKTDPLGERELRRWFAEPETVTMISARETGAPMSVVKRQQHRALLDDLRAMDGIDFRKTRGQWWDGETKSMRVEPSFVIRGLTFDQALGLARKYNQEGFIFKNVDGAALMYENYRDVDLEAGRKPTAMPALRGGKPLFGPEAVEVKPLKKIKTLDEEKTEKQRRDDAAKGRQEKRKPDPAQEPNLFVHSRSISFELPFDFTDEKRLMPWDGSGPVSRAEVESYYEPPAGQEAPPPAPTPAEPPAAEPGTSDPDPRVGAQGSVRAGAVDAAARRSAAAEGRLVALRSVGYQRYEGRLPDGAVVRVGAEDRVDHGSYPSGRRQRRRRVWVVRVGGEVFGEAATLAAARDLVETAAGQHRVAQSMQMPAKDAALHEILRDANIPYPADFTAADNAYRRWKNQYARFRPARPIYEGGELDAPNIALSLEGDRRLSGLLHAWERLTEGVRRWDDPRLEKALDVLSEVPGLEGVRLPEWVLAAKAEAAYWQDLERYAARESVGVFIRLPDDLDWPADEQVGTPHFTLVTVPSLPDEQKAAFFEAVEDVLASTEPITVELSPGVEFFESHKGETIAHKGVTEEAEAWMRDLNARLRGALADAGIEVEARDFIPHATLAYLDEERWDGPVPEGRFEVSELEVWGFDNEVPVRLGWTSEHKVARRRKKKTDSERRKRVYRPTWYIREGSQVAWNAAFDVAGLREVTLAPGARVLQVGEHMLRTASKTDLDLAKIVEQQSATIERLSRIVEQLMARNSSYDAIQTEDRLIVLNPKALEEQPPRKRWLKADADRVHEPAPEPAVA